MRSDLKEINREDWEKALGVIVEGTNSALALRDYSIKCHTPNLIIVVKGYWIWWCSTHHQPHHMCKAEKGRLWCEERS